jgi:hypothetical protein
MPLDPRALDAAIAAVRHGARIEMDTRADGPLALLRWDEAERAFTLTTDAATVAALLLVAG